MSAGNVAQLEGEISIPNVAIAVGASVIQRQERLEIANFLI